MGRHEFPSEIQAQETLKAQSRYLLFRNIVKSDQSLEGKYRPEPKTTSSPEPSILALG